MNFLRLFFYMTVTGLLYLGVPLLGWGLGDLAGYFSNSPRLGYAVLVGWFSLAIDPICLLNVKPYNNINLERRCNRKRF